MRPLPTAPVSAMEPRGCAECERDGHCWKVELLRKEVSLLRALVRHAPWAATHDRLTGLLNRDGLHGIVADVSSGTPWSSSACLYVDLDGFKPVNDLFGHDVGDAVLSVVGRRLARLSGLVAARMGGDEFAGLLPDNRDPQGVAMEIVAQIARPITVGGVVLEVGASIGIARLDDGVTLAEALRRADIAMLNAKRGAAPIGWWTPSWTPRRVAP